MLLAIVARGGLVLELGELVMILRALRMMLMTILSIILYPGRTVLIVIPKSHPARSRSPTGGDHRAFKPPKAGGALAPVTADNPTHPAEDVGSSRDEQAACVAVRNAVRESFDRQPERRWWEAPGDIKACNLRTVASPPNVLGGR
ncbi:hypothetical protein [Caulobacter sp. CCUG 60055]|uniref:hypothetical protein n=1 Tax=Caulobacter sp. CCUG 60055 TaxID=2100090 RepID=UPI001FA6C80D|nr:hypothetical protein [Caulobacter sp. CCUG 60055]